MADSSSEEKDTIELKEEIKQNALSNAVSSLETAASLEETTASLEEPIVILKKEDTKQKNICLLHPDVSASRLINNSYLAISIPWSSTAFIGEYYQKKSIFYDPFQMLDLNDRGRQNCKLLQGKKSLEKFANTL